MKPAFYLLTILSLTLAASQSAQAQAAKTDTIFIRKDSLEGVAQSIFIETNKHSKYYKNLTSFQFGKFDKESYDNSLSYLKTHKIKLKKQKTILPSTKWLTLKQYHGRFYAYYPCDFYTYYQASVNDTTYIDWTGEGPIANKIKSQRKLNDSTFKINVTGIYDPERTIVIHIIDKSKGIAVFTETTDRNGKNNYLMIMADKIKTIPLIVNNCQQHKTTELEFEEPNFSKLLPIK